MRHEHRDESPGPGRRRYELPVIQDVDAYGSDGGTALKFSVISSDRHITSVHARLNIDQAVALHIVTETENGPLGGPDRHPATDSGTLWGRHLEIDLASELGQNPQQTVDRKPAIATAHQIRNLGLVQAKPLPYFLLISLNAG